MDSNKKTTWDIELIRKVSALDTQYLALEEEALDIKEQLNFLVKASNNLTNIDNLAVQFLQQEISRMNARLDVVKGYAQQIEHEMVAWREVKAVLNID